MNLHVCLLYKRREEGCRNIWNILSSFPAGKKIQNDASHKIVILTQYEERCSRNVAWTCVSVVTSLSALTLGSGMYWHSTLPQVYSTHTLKPGLPNVSLPPSMCSNDWIENFIKIQGYFLPWQIKLEFAKGMTQNKGKLK